MHKEKHLKFAPLPLALAAALAVPVFVNAEQAPAEAKTSRTLVEVNGEAIKEQHFLVYRAQRNTQGQPMDQQAQLAMLNELINTVMIAQSAQKQGLDTHPELLAAMDVARYRILAEASVEQFLRDNPVKDDEIAAIYKSRYADAKLTEYKARHILLKTEDDAKAVIAELDKGTDFAELAKTKSTGPSGPNGGDLGWFEAGQMVKPFADATASMEKGSHSATPVKTQFGWHVIKLEDSRAQTPPALDSVRTSLAQDLQRERIAGFIRDIRAKADVKIMEQEKAKPAPAAAKQ